MHRLCSWLLHLEYWTIRLHSLSCGSLCFCEWYYKLHFLPDRNVQSWYCYFVRSVSRGSIRERNRNFAVYRLPGGLQHERHNEFHNLHPMPRRDLRGRNRVACLFTLSCWNFLQHYPHNHLHPLFPRLCFQQFFRGYELRAVHQQHLYGCVGRYLLWHLLFRISSQHRNWSIILCAVPSRN